MLLEHIKGIKPDTELEAEYKKLLEKANKILNQLEMLTEDDMSSMSDRLAGQDAMPAPGQVAPESGNMADVMAAMDQVMRQMDAAKRGLGLVNKLGDSPSRTMNRSRVMGNLNRIRANLGRIEKMLSNAE